MKKITFCTGEDCDCPKCLEKDYNDSNGTWFPDEDSEKTGN